MSKTHAKNDHLSAGLHYTTVSFLVAGILMLTSASHTVIFARSSGQGSSVIESISGEAKLIAAEGHSAALPEKPIKSAARDLAIGSILVFIGFLFHALLVIRNERPVPVRAGVRQPKIHIRQLYWMEIIPKRRK
ncbi:hypothetical protein A3D88_03730 [Candidatus Peribacteria bacterium RIFCSPHIGHO2_02_FULL_52_16]|nr:MAG: hypothetical protein A2706_04545 [Candidatus Peribacteria bacterium RIFCSPHIGHO2_01_FULL_51_35]OGJ61792.1 MAG: hypothetical protein A3D88_03730 [Candidatus Peribacteria bacterium RIFCSPHIGHO2_02_FULL_52_16]